MRKILSGIVVLMACVTATAAPPKTPLNSQWAPGEYVQTRTQQQQERIRALAKRGKAANYEQLLRSGIPRASFDFSTALANQSPQERQQQADYEEITKRAAAIELAALGFTTQDVADYRKRSHDLYGVIHRFRLVTAAPEDYMLLADTVVTAKAIKNDPTPRTRLDGYLTALSFKVVKPLKGLPLSGDVIYHPQMSGVNPDGTISGVTSEFNTKPGRTYLLVLSKNWYEQKATEEGKQPEVGFNAIAFLAYEVADDGTLLPGPRAALSGATPKDTNTVEAALKQMPQPRHPREVRP